MTIHVECRLLTKFRTVHTALDTLDVFRLSLSNVVLYVSTFRELIERCHAAISPIAIVNDV